MMDKSLETRSEHWQEFYEAQNKQAVPIPSQFAAFVAQEVPRDCAIIDVGCGNGRDSLFFARHGFRCVGVDQSEEALAVARRFGDSLDAGHVRFVAQDISVISFPDLAVRQPTLPVCVYARFFLHAITEIEQAQFFQATANFLTAGDVFAVEYRTIDDEDADKVASPHYRRYQASCDVDTQLSSLGFTKAYGVEAQGLAKYQSEDAHVARGIFKKL